MTPAELTGSFVSDHCACGEETDPKLVVHVRKGEGLCHLRGLVSPAPAITEDAYAPGWATRLLVWFRPRRCICPPAPPGAAR